MFSAKGKDSFTFIFSKIAPRVAGFCHTSLMFFVVPFLFLFAHNIFSGNKNIHQSRTYHLHHEPQENTIFRCIPTRSID